MVETINNANSAVQFTHSAQTNARRVAAIDCGTNSIRLLIAEVDPQTNILTELEPRKTRINRLGYGVDKTGEFDAKSLELTFEIEREYANYINKYNIKPENIRFIATSASRDAKNREEFFRTTQEILGVTPEVISGEEEARLSFNGLISAFQPHNSADLRDCEKIVVDLGGGSTELIYGDSTLKNAYSMNIGSVRITERHFDSAMEVPTERQIDTALADITEAIDDALANLFRINTETPRKKFFNIGHLLKTPNSVSIIGVAGTVTTLTAYHLGLNEYDREKVNGVTMDLKCAVKCCSEIIAMPKSEIRKLGFILPGRVDVIQAGCLIWRTVLLRINEISPVQNVICSEHDILDGIALNI